MDDGIYLAANNDNGAFDTADDNVIQKFRLESSALQGRVARLGSALNDILEPHEYPEPLAHLVAETLTMTLLLSSMLKYDGVFSLQTKGDGPVSMLVADINSDGDIRACAHFDAERFEQARQQLSALKSSESAQNHLAQYLGKGYIAFTVDQGDKTDRYQGIVELKGQSLTECVQHYFTTSENIETGIKMAVGRRDGEWRAGGIMLQNADGDGAHKGSADEDDWRRSMMLMETCTEDELLDPDLHSNLLLTRLFHEEGVRVYAPLDIKKGCRCDTQKVENIISMMPDDDLGYMTVEGRITMRCEFCSRDFVFDLKDLKRKIRTQDSELTTQD